MEGTDNNYYAIGYWGHETVTIKVLYKNKEIEIYFVI